MSRSPGVGNRVALSLWALVLLGAASWVLVPAVANLLDAKLPTGAEGTWLAQPSRRILDVPGSIAAEPWFAAAVIGLGVLLLLLAVAWLIRQLPRSTRAGTLKLSHDVVAGVTQMEPNVLERALKQMAEDDPAVHSAQVTLQGSASSPALTVHLTTEPWAQLPELATAVSDRLREAVRISLREELRSLTLDFSVARKQRQRSERSDLATTTSSGDKA